MRKSLLVVLSLLCLTLPSTLFAQRTTGTPKTFTLTFQVNPPNAAIFVNGDQIKGNKAPALAAGSYTVSVKAPGFVDFNTTVNLSGDMTIPVNLQPMNFLLSVNAGNVKGAQVLINNNPAGQTPFSTQLPPGSYSLIIRAPGFMDYVENFSFNAPKAVNVTLQPLNFQLSVNAANVKGAQVLINNNPAGQTPFNAQLAPGSYSVTVRAPGFVDYVENFALNGPKAMSVTLQPLTFQLSVNAANVQGAQVLINNNPAGQTPFNANLAPGSYSLIIRAPGFVDYAENFALNGPKSVNISLQPQTFQLTVNSANVKGAQVLINGNAAGQTPFATQLAIGSYSVTIKAPGFFDYAESFQLTGAKEINATLQPQIATFQVTLPAANINTDVKGGHWSQIQVYIDGVLQKSQSGQVSPGKKMVKITAGGMQVQSMVDFQAGKAYTFEPFMGVTVK